MSEFIYFFKEGFFHVLDWQAYDHVLFFIALVAAYVFKDWKRILLLVSLFTIGHTGALFLAAYKVVSVNSGIVEFLIPVTILLTALFNIFTANNTSKENKVGVLYAATVFFGVIHGFGFSGHFRMISSAWESKFLAIIEFALGIEISQILVVVLVLIVSFIAQNFLRFSKRDWILIISSIVIGMVIPMVIENKIW